MEDKSIPKKIELPNGETYAYLEKGTGDKILVLIHGNLSSSVHWDVLMEALPENEYRIIAPDLRGFGDSSYNRPIEIIKDFSEDLKMFVDTLNLKDFALAGWSLGGLVSLQFTADYPEYVTHLVLVGSTIKAEPFPKFDLSGKIIPGQFLTTRKDMEDKNKDTVKTIAERDYDKMQFGLNMMVYNNKKPEPERYKRYMDAIFQQRNKVDADYAILQFNISHNYNGLREGTSEVDKITSPTLVLQGANDIIVPVAHAKSTVEEIGENAKLVLLENAGHSPFTDCSDRLAEEFRDFIK